MKNNPLLLLLTLAFLVGTAGCGRESLPPEGEPFYHFYPEIETMQVTGVAAIADGFFILGFHIGGQGDAPVPFLVRTDAEGNLDRSWNHRLAARSVMGVPTNLLTAPNGDLYFGARHTDTVEDLPVIYRIHRDELSGGYTLSQWSPDDPSRWLVPPITPGGEITTTYTDPIALAWDTAANQLLIYSNRNFSQDNFDKRLADICISAMSPKGIPDTTKMMQFYAKTDNHQYPSYVTDYKYTPFLIKTERYLYFNLNDISDAGLSNNALWMVCLDKSSPAYGRLARPSNGTYLNLFGVIPDLAPDATPAKSDSMLLENGRYYVLCREEEAIEPRIALIRHEGGTSYPEMVMRTQRFSTGNNILLRSVSNHRYLQVASNRDGGMRVRLLGLKDDHVVSLMEANVLSGGDYAPSAITETADGDFIIAGSVLTYERTSTLFLLKVDGNTLTFSRDTP